MAEYSWRRAPTAELVEAFGPSGPFAPLTEAVRALSGVADIHLWSDRRASVHRARIWAGAVRIIDLHWESARFAVHLHRDLRDLRSGAGAWQTLAATAGAWQSMRAAAGVAARLAGSLPEAIAAVRGPARDPRALLERADLLALTQEYAPVFGSEAVRRAALGTLARDVIEALDPSPVPGSGLIVSFAPDALAIDATGALTIVRAHGPRAPEARFGVAQAVVDLRVLHRVLEDADFAELARVRRELGLSSAPDPAGVARAVIGIDAESSPRLRSQFELVAATLRSAGVGLDHIAVVET